MKMKIISLAALALPLLLVACGGEPNGYYGSEYPDGGGASVSGQSPTVIDTYQNGSVAVTPGATYYDGYWHGGHAGRQ